MITEIRLKEVLNYYPLIGIFIWKRANGGQVSAGDIAGSVHCRDGCIHIGLEGKIYKAHRLAWLYMTGNFPSEMIDHKDRDPSNNKWNNLRLADKVSNARNCNISTANTSGVTGVIWDENRSKYKSQIMVCGKCIFLGRFDSFESAVKVRYKAETKYGFTELNKTSSAKLYIERNEQHESRS